MERHQIKNYIINIIVIGVTRTCVQTYGLWAISYDNNASDITVLKAYDHTRLSLSDILWLIACGVWSDVTVLNTCSLMAISLLLNVRAITDFMHETSYGLSDIITILKLLSQH